MSQEDVGTTVVTPNMASMYQSFMEKAVPAFEKFRDAMSAGLTKIVSFIQNMRLLSYTHAGITGYLLINRSEKATSVYIIYPAYSAIPDADATDYGRFVGNICNEAFLKNFIKREISKKCMRKIKSISFAEPISTPVDWSHAVATFNLLKGKAR